MSSAHQVFWFIAIIFSVLFFIQLILLLIGYDPDRGGGMEHTMETVSFENGFSVLSLRSIIAFFTFFGWTGVAAIGHQYSVWIAVLASSLMGFAAMFSVAYLMFKFAQLEQSGTLNLYQLLDQTGEVFLTIPARKQGRGKVQLLINGQSMEWDAITEGDILQAGCRVKVIEILEGNVLKVESLG
jgi:NfeD-like C-terminal, partner-binding